MDNYHHSKTVDQGTDTSNLMMNMYTQVLNDADMINNTQLEKLIDGYKRSTDVK